MRETLFLIEHSLHRDFVPLEENNISSKKNSKDCAKRRRLRKDSTREIMIYINKITLFYYNLPLNV